MSTKKTLLLFITLATMSANAQRWKIHKVVTYNSVSKKTKIDSTADGTISISKDFKAVLFYEDSVISFFDFNCYEKIETGWPQYKIYWKGFNPKSQGVIRLWCTDEHDIDDMYDAKLSLSQGNSSTTYYLTKDDSYDKYTRETYLHFIDTSFAVIKFNWIYSGIESNNETYYFSGETDKSSYYYSKEIEVWMKIELKTHKYKGVVYKNVVAKSQWTFDCQNKRISNKDYYYYNAKGNIINVEENYSAWQTVVPETIGEGLLKKACEILKR